MHFRGTRSARRRTGDPRQVDCVTLIADRRHPDERCVVKISGGGFYRDFLSAVSIGNKTVQKQLAQCRFPGLAISNAKIYDSSIQFIRQQRAKGHFNTQYTIYNNYSAGQCIQYV